MPRALPHHRTLAQSLVALTLAAATVAGCNHERGPDVVAPEVIVAQPTPEPEIAAASFAEKRYTVCRVDLDVSTLDIFWQDDDGVALKSFSRLDTWLRGRGRRLAFAMNAGMYLEDYRPVGLYVEGGDELRPLNLARGSSNFCLLPNGVFAITESGAVVVESSAYTQIQAETSLATQSGPMLVIDGKLHPKFGRNSTSVHIRNGVGVISPTEVVFAISDEPVNFHEFATFFRDELGCENALYLDGAISSLYSPALGRDDHLANLGPILGVASDL